MTKLQLLIFLMLFGTLLVPFTSAAATGCCANLKYLVSGEYCTQGAMTQAQCCNDKSYTSGNSHYPSAYPDCADNFFGVTCSASNLNKRCDIGCCYDQTIGCIGATQDSCLGHFVAQKWDTGFSVAQNRRSDGNPCYTNDGVKFFPECPGSGTTCASYTTAATCTTNSCNWCSTANSCVADCSSCASQPKANDNTHICEAPTSNDICTDAQRQTESTCAVPGTHCKWCPLPDNLACMDDCHTCSGSVDLFPTDSDNDQVCDAGNSPSCTNTYDRVPSASEFCCRSSSDNLIYPGQGKCSCSRNGYCCQVAAQCDSSGGGYGLVPSDQYDTASCANCCYTPCSTVNPCTDQEQISTNNDPGHVLGSDHYCMCANQVLKVADSATKDKYCCSNTLSDSVCSLATFHGNIREPDGSLILEAVKFTLKNAVTGTTQSFQNTAPHAFSVQLSKGNYYLAAELAGYTLVSPTSINADPSTQMDITQDIVMQQIDPTCTTFWPSITLTGNVISCNNQVHLSWDVNLCTDKLKGWEVYRDDVLKWSTNDPTAREHTDNGLEPDKTYNYVVKAIHEHGKNSSNIFQQYTGNAECLSSTTCSGKSFCKGNLIMSCDANNILQTLDDCGAYSSSCLLEADGAPYCVKADSCSQTKLPIPNFLAMYGMLSVDQMIQDACYSKDNSMYRYCYFDSGSSTADSCKDCSSSMLCYDYSTKNACDKNNCNVQNDGKVYSCKWYSDNYAYAELGHGVCSATGYNGTDYCSRCGPDNSIFSKSHCSSQVCDLLGSCYSKKDFSACLSCKNPPDATNPTKCSDFTDLQSCVQSNGLNVPQPFSISFCADPSHPAGPKSGTRFTPSADACRLGVCRWDASTLSCVKDANYDQKDDCKGKPAKCQQDTLPPTTSVVPPEKVNAESLAEARFTFSDYGWGPTNLQTYYCIDSAGICCPYNKLSGDKLTLNAELPELKLTTAKMYLRFFSVDGYNNTEMIKNVSLDVDTVYPKLTVVFNTSNTTGTSDRSDIGIKISATEAVQACTDELKSLSDSTASSNLKDGSIASSSSLTTTYQNLPDGWYSYSVSCADSFGNKNLTRLFIEVDRVHLIINEIPTGKKFRKSDVITLSFETVGERLICTSQKSGDPQPLPLNNMPSGVNYKYTYIIGSLPGNYYTYSIECRKVAGGPVVDRTAIFFVVDDLAPRSSLFYEDYSNHFAPFDSNSWYSRLKLKFKCDDSSARLGTNPGPFGCDGIFYCTDTVNRCVPVTKLAGDSGIADFSQQAKPFYVRYASKDLGGNNETVNSVLVRMDKDAPKLIITSPEPGQVFGNRHVTLAGSWQDSASSVDITVGIVSANNSSAMTFTSNTHQFSQPLSLFGGENTLSIRSDDSGVGGGINLGAWQSFKVYLDSVPPVFSEVVILNHLGERIDNHEKSAGYGSPVQFSATITDPQWTNNVTRAIISVECTNQTACSSYRKNFTMVRNGTLFNYVINPLSSGILLPGPYFVKCSAFDSYNNRQTYNRTFVVANAEDFPAFIYNHLGERIDDSTHQAEYSQKIGFVAAPQKTDIISTMEVTIQCSDVLACADHPKRRTFQLLSSGPTYNLTLQPASPDILLPKGTYLVTFTAHDRFGKIMTTLKSFQVADTSSLDAMIFNNKLERIDDLSHKAEYAYPISFNLTSTRLDTIVSAQLTLRCQNISLCGNSRPTFQMQRIGDAYYFLHVPVKDSHSVFFPDVGVYNVLFTIQDTFGMYRTILKNFTVADSTEPVISIAVKTTTIDSLTGQPKIGIGNSACRWYDVVVASNKAINITSLKLSVFKFDLVRPRIIDFRNQPVPKISANADVWTYSLCLPFEDINFRWLRGNNSEFLIDAVDKHNLRTTQVVTGRYIEIDTHGGDEPILFPDLPAVYYARSNLLSLNGMVNPQEASVQLNLNLSGTLDSTVSSGLSTKLFSNETFSAVEAGTNIFEVDGDETYNFAPARFVKFDGHDRFDGSYYKIMSSSFDPGTLTTKVILQDSLEKSVASQEVCSVYSAGKPTGYFSFSPKALKEGKNQLSIWAVDDLGNIGRKLQRTIIYDTVPFKIQSFTPHDGSVFADKLPNVTVSLFDESSSVNITSLRLTINDDSYACGAGLMCDDSGKYIIVRYVPSQPLDDASYQVTFEGADTMGNKNKISWTFTVDSTVPVLKKFEVQNARFYPIPLDRWYSPSSRFIAIFAFEQATIEGSASLTGVGTTVGCAVENSVAVCELGSPLSDGSYELVGSFRKSLASGFGSYGSYSFFVTVDTVNPELVFDPVYPSSKKEQEITGSFVDQNMDETDSIVLDGSAPVSPVSAMIVGNAFSSVITLGNVPEGNYSITATATDKAGNIGTKSVVLKYDLSCSPVRIVMVNSTYPGGIVVKKTDDYYYANVGTRQDGISVKGLGEQGVIRLYSSYLSSGLRTEPTLQKTLDVVRTFVMNLTLFQDNDENYLTFENTDVAGNTFSTTVTVASDTTGPNSPILSIDKNPTSLIEIGKTGLGIGISGKNSTSCLSYLSVVESDSCMINLLLSGDKSVCPFIANFQLRLSCEAVV